LTIAILIGYRYDITLWDWAKLLIVPAVIAGGGLWFNAQQRERELQIANQRLQDEALQAYLDQVSHMLTDTEKPLHRAQPGDYMTTVARARTLTVLSRLENVRKASVLRFLYESGLINKTHRVLDLREADLSGADLSEANPPSANLTKLTKGEDPRASREVQILRPDFTRTEAEERAKKLLYANLDYLGKAKLHGAKLSGADLSETNLLSANLSRADLSEADLKGLT